MHTTQAIVHVLDSPPYRLNGSRVVSVALKGVGVGLYPTSLACENIYHSDLRPFWGLQY